ncbi:MAG: hypothetical protein JSS07_12745 [Proteobacteria bacterium]|nr:hypothetical protein [Pseudomonadota bacterium]
MQPLSADDVEIEIDTNDAHHAQQNILRADANALIVDLKKAYTINQGLYEPVVGDVVTRVHNDPLGRIWFIVHNKGRMHPRASFSFNSIKRSVYSGHGSGETWVLQCASDSSRNPVWTDPAENKNGEGEREQRHCIVTRSEVGIIEYWFYPTPAIEIAAIERSSKKQITELYRCRNRTKVTVVPTPKDLRQGGGYVAVISDYIYFSPEACDLRQRCVQSGILASTDPTRPPPVYSRDFSALRPTIVNTLPVVPGIGDIPDLSDFTGYTDLLQPQP